MVHGDVYRKLRKKTKLKGTVMQIEKALIENCVRVSKVF